MLVLLQMLRQTHGAMELVDVSSELPDLKRMPGLSTWLVRDKATFRRTYTQVPPPLIHAHVLTPETLIRLR